MRTILTIIGGALLGAYFMKLRETYRDTPPAPRAGWPFNRGGWK